MAMSQSNRFEYLSIFDPAHSTSLWPHKNFREVRAEEQRDAARIERILRVNLLWRPTVLLRHMDLFNSLPLMRFMRTQEAAALCEAGLIQVAVPEDTNFKELFELWALHGSSQHWHHLSKEQQCRYDDSFHLGKIRSIADIEDAVSFSDHNIEIQRTLREYDYLLSDHRIVLRSAPPPDWYSHRVLERWKQFLKDDRHTARHRSRDLTAIAAAFKRGVEEQWRRRRYFTELDRLEGELRTASLKENIILQAKLLAVNTAFYDELEECRITKSDKRAPVSVVRDVTQLTTSGFGNPIESAPDPTLCKELQPMDDITLSHIVKWHSSDDAESIAFRNSIRKIQAVIHSKPETFPRREIHRRIDDHISALNACIERAEHKDSTFKQRTNTVVQLLWPDSHFAAQPLVGIGLGLAAALVPAVAHFDALLSSTANFVIGTLTSGAVTICLGAKAKSREWRGAECTLKYHIEDSVFGSSRDSKSHGSG